MSVIDKLNQIKSCKEDIKQAIIDKGVDMTNVAFTEYATKISEIQAGGSGDTDYLDMRNNLTNYYSTVEIVGGYAFARCSSLQSVNLPICRYVEGSTFTYCSSLQSVNLPMCRDVEGFAFNFCKSLQSVNLPICGYIGYSTFANCSSLQYANLPMCGYIGNFTFTNCSSLQSVNLQICSYLGNSAFSYCKSLSILDLRSTYSCTLSNSGAFSRTQFASGIGSIYVHNAVLSQFQTATNWTYFSNCLVGVGDPNTPLLSFENGRIYGETGGVYSNYTSYLNISKNNVAYIDLPKCVYVEKSVFSSCSYLQSVNLPMCNYVGDYEFTYCSQLQSVNLPMCGYVGSSAFAKCSSLQSIDLQMCSYVGSNVFLTCTSLQSVNLPMCSYVGDYAFQSCTSLQSVNLPMCSYVGDYAFQSCSSLQSVNLPICSYLGEYVFSRCSSLTTLTVGISTSVVCELGTDAIPSTISSIYVAMSLVDAYKVAPNWSSVASRIYGI